jgi:hypothetical protein
VSRKKRFNNLSIAYPQKAHHLVIPQRRLPSHPLHVALYYLDAFIHHPRLISSQTVDKKLIVQSRCLFAMLERQMTRENKEIIEALL